MTMKAARPFGITDRDQPTEAQRKALKVASVMLLQARGHLLCGVTSLAASTIFRVVVPYLARAAGDEAASTQAAFGAMVVYENLSGSYPLIDWAALDRAEACVERGQPLEAIAALCDVLRLPERPKGAASGE